MHDLKIILMPSLSKWFIQNDNGWYSLENPSEVEEALSVLPLTIIDEYSQIDLQPIKGTSSVSGAEDGQMTVQAWDVVGNIDFTKVVEINASCLCNIEWQDPPYVDGWVKDKFRVFVDNVDTYSLKVYLPPLEGIKEKSVTVQNVTSGETKEILLARDRQNFLGIVDSRFDKKQEILLSCDSEPLVNSSDTRELGFVLLEEIISA